MNECTHTLDYQLIDEGRKTTKTEQLKGAYGFLSCGCIDLVCRARSTFLPDNPCREVGLAEYQHRIENSSKSTLVVIFWFKGTPAKNGSWYLEERYTTDLEDYRKGY